GTRLKILEAMAIGTPVVATSKGAEGLSVQNGHHLLMADEPESFAAHVVQLLKNKHSRDHISANALQLVKDYYDWPVLMPKLLGLVENAVAG
ncbi:MAG: glycosyltransferase, partial [Anaerolineales bacterium]